MDLTAAAAAVFAIAPNSSKTRLAWIWRSWHECALWATGTGPLAQTGASMAQIFISYSSKDRPLAEQVDRALRRAGYTTWWDDALTPSEQWTATIEREFDASLLVFVLWTENSVNSKWVKLEAEYAVEKNKLIHARFDASTPPMFARQTQYADLINWAGDDADRNWQRVLRWIEERLGAGDTPVANLETEAGRVWASLAQSTDLRDLELFEETFRNSPEARLSFARRAALTWGRLKDNGTPDQWRAFIKTFAGTAEAKEAYDFHYRRELAALNGTEDVARIDRFIAEFDGTTGALAARKQKIALNDWLTVSRQSPDLIKEWMNLNSEHLYLSNAHKRHLDIIQQRGVEENQADRRKKEDKIASNIFIILGFIFIAWVVMHISQGGKM